MELKEGFKWLASYGYVTKNGKRVRTGGDYEHLIDTMQTLFKDATVDLSEEEIEDEQYNIPREYDDKENLVEFGMGQDYYVIEGIGVACKNDGLLTPDNFKIGTLGLSLIHISEPTRPY